MLVHQYSNDVTNIEIQSPTSSISYQFLVANNIMSPTSVSPNLSVYGDKVMLTVVIFEWINSVAIIDVALFDITVNHIFTRKITYAKILW